MRIRSWIDRDACVFRARGVKRIHDRAFGVILLAGYLDAQLLSSAGDRIVQFVQPLVPVDLWFPLAKQVEVRTVQNQDAHHFPIFFEGKARASAPVALMPDELFAASNLDAGVALVAAVTTELVTEIRERHDLWPTATAAVGRLVTGAALLATSLKGNERISLQIAGDGPLGTLAADAWLLGEVTIGARGYARNGRVELPVDARGKFNVSEAVGAGSLQVTRSADVGQPYVGIVPIHSGEIAEDIAVYLTQSEQIPSVVGLGVLANPSGVAAAGGVLARALPGADERAVAALEQRAAAMPPVTQLIAEGRNANALLRELAGDLELRTHHQWSLQFACRCNREKVEAVLLGLGADELLELTRERDRTEATCEYCKTRYVFTAHELRRLAERL